MPSTTLIFTLSSHRSHLFACLDVPPSPALPSTSPTPQLDLFDCPCPPPHSSSPFHCFVSHLFAFPDVPPFSLPMPSTTLIFTLPSLCFPPLHFPTSPPIFFAYALHRTHLHPSVASFPTSSLSWMSPHFHHLCPLLHLSSPFCPFISPISSLAQMSCTAFHHSNLSVGSFHAHFLHHPHLHPSVASFPTSSLVWMSPLLPHCLVPLCPFISPISSLARMSCTTFHHSNLSVGSFHAHLLHCTHLRPSVASFPTSSLVWMSPLLLHCLLPLQSLGWTISPPSLHHTCLHPSITFAALYLLQHLKVHFPAASYPPPSSSNFSRHASLASTLHAASKIICNDTYSDKSWHIISQGSSLSGRSTRWSARCAPFWRGN